MKKTVKKIKSPSVKKDLNKNAKSFKPADRRSVGELIKDQASSMFAKIRKQQMPSMHFPIRSLSNVVYDSKNGHFQLLGKKSERTLSYNTVKTFAQSIRMMAESKKLIITDDMASKREIYYVAKGDWAECKFNEQSESDAVMDDVEAMFEVNREQLGFIPEEKGGEVAGQLIVIDRDRISGKEIRIDCTKFGSGAYSIPSRVEELKFETKADFILVVETSALFQRLIYHSYWKKARCILVAMGGVPTRACRRFIRLLADSRKLPVYVFTDGDPYGYGNIYRTLKVGSGNAAHINQYFCVPQAKFLGVTPQDIIDFDLKDVTYPLNDTDIKRAKDALKNDPFFKFFKEWRKAFEQMIKMQVRVEQQAFAKHGLNFVLEKYLPKKLKNPEKFLP
ncbi:MAG: DNA topoisomerase IV subunit A [bacterium]